MNEKFTPEMGDRPQKKQENELNEAWQRKITAASCFLQIEDGISEEEAHNRMSTMNEEDVAELAEKYKLSLEQDPKL